jgi:peptide/nickel transport system ATP-binding protein
VSEPFVVVDDLRVSFNTEDGVVHAVDGVSFTLEKGKTIAIVGESGSGKSVTSQAIMGLHPPRSADISGRITVGGKSIVGADDQTVRELRGKTMAMIFQDPLSSLHPFYKIGYQLVEAVQVHQNVSKKVALEHAVRLLERVGIPKANDRIHAYPHELSGGMRQRVMIAMALINSPDLLIADEPTTALDVTVQAQIIELLRDLQQEFGMAIIIITHALGVVAQVADDVVVMYGGRVVEHAPIDELFADPKMPYTWGLLESIPDLDRPRGAPLTPIPGQPPSLIGLPVGCVFGPRCVYTEHVSGSACQTVRPDLVEVAPRHFSRCLLTPDQLKKLAPGHRTSEVAE